MLLFVVAINLDEVRKVWLTTTGNHHIKQIADHYGVFEHLFGDAYFFPRVPLQVFYTENDVQHPVYYGNVIKPKTASVAPEVVFESDNDSLWTIILTNPDGHFTESNKEYVHWFVYVKILIKNTFSIYLILEEIFQEIRSVMVKQFINIYNHFHQKEPVFNVLFLYCINRIKKLITLILNKLANGKNMVNYNAVNGIFSFLV